MLGHDYDEGVVTKDPTCTGEGIKTFACQRGCGEEGELYTESIAALGHVEMIDHNVVPDCENTGLTEGMHCIVCSEVLIAQDVIPANGHEEVVDAAVVATCTNTGLTEGMHCSICEKILVVQETVDPLGHAEVIDPPIKPTCTDTGLTEGKHCLVCGETLVAREEIPESGHSIAFEKKVYEVELGEDPHTAIVFAACGHEVTVRIEASDEIEVLNIENLRVQFTGVSCGVAKITAETDDKYRTTAVCQVIVHAQEKLALPKGLRIIGEEAFMCMPVQENVVGDCVEIISSRAFVECVNLRLINLPDTVVEIAKDVFSGCDSLTIICSTGSIPQKYAEENGIPYVTR